MLMHCTGPYCIIIVTRAGLQLGGFAFIGEGIPIGLGAAFKVKYKRVSQYVTTLISTMLLTLHSILCPVKTRCVILHITLHSDSASHFYVGSAP